MARKTKMPANSPAFWPLEAEPSELQAYVTKQMQGPANGEQSGDDSPVEPAWFREAFDASWPLALALAEAEAGAW